MASPERNGRLPENFIDAVSRLKITPEEKVSFPAVIWFHRYVGCPLCLYEMNEIKNNFSQFSKKEYNVYVVLQSDKGKVASMLEKFPMPFPVISDPERSLYEIMEVEPADSLKNMLGDFKEEADEKLGKAVSLGYIPGEPDGNEFQLPAVFVIDSNKKVSFAHYASFLIDLPPVEEILAML